MKGKVPKAVSKAMPKAMPQAVPKPPALPPHRGTVNKAMSLENIIEGAENSLKVHQVLRKELQIAEAIPSAGEL